MYSLTYIEGYQRLLKDMAADKDGKVSGDSLWRFLHNRQPHIQRQVQRFIVKHHSEWLHDGMSALWRMALDEQARQQPALALYNRQFLDALVWMKEVPEIRSSEALWHVHPVTFLEAIALVRREVGKITGKEFVNFVFKEAKNDEVNSRVPAAITTAQAILETGYGKAVPIDIYTGKYSYNLFGIKAHGNPNFIWVNTHEYLNGVRTKIVDKFMAYSSYEESISGRSEFFVKNKRYHFLFAYQDPCDWAKGLQRAGYATDPAYANKLISIMRRELLI